MAKPPFHFFPSLKYHHMRDFKNWVHDDSLKATMPTRGKTRGKTIGDSLNCRWFLRVVMSWTSQVAGKWSPQQRASCQQLRVPRHPSGPSIERWQTLRWTCCQCVISILCFCIEGLVHGSPVVITYCRLLCVCGYPCLYCNSKGRQPALITR